MPSGSKPIDLTGTAFGRLTAVKIVRRANSRHVFWECLCSCGQRTTVNVGNLRSGKVKSCGCLRREMYAAGTAHRRHGHARKQQQSPEFKIWVQILQRCNNPNNRAWKNYGGRGITVCDTWQGHDGFQRFLDDVGTRPSAHLTLDRKNNNLGYEPGNCVWVSRTTQNSNRRNVHLVTYQGRTQSLAAWSRELKRDYETLRRRFKQGVQPPDLFSNERVRRT